MENPLDPSIRSIRVPSTGDLPLLLTPFAVNTPLLSTWLLATEGGMGQLEAERRRDRLERLLVCWPSTRIVDVACPMVALAQFAA